MSTENEKPDGAGDDQNANDSSVDNANNTDNGKPDGEGEPSNNGQPSNGQDDKGGDADDKSDDGSDDKGNNDQSDSYSDFELPDGMTVDENLLGTISPILKEAGVNQEQAQKLVSAYAEHIQGINQGQIDAHNSQVEEWESQLKADKELGGDKFEENMKVARDGLEKFGSPELIKFLNETGLGNHPEMARAFHKIGLLTQDDSPGNSGGGGGQEKDIEDRWYGEDS